MTPLAQAAPRVALVAALAVAGVYAYAALALVARRRLAARAPPRGLAEAALLGLLVPACGCTALPYARRCAPRERAAFVTAAYAGNPLLVLAALLLAGPLVAALVVALALVAALAHAALPPHDSPPPRVRLDDLLLRRDGAAWRDAAPYVREFGTPAIGAGLVLGVVSLAPPLAAGLALAALALVMAPPRVELGADHGNAFVRRALALHLVFALGLGAAGVLA